MSDIYATPEADLAQAGYGERSGGNIDDAAAGNFKVDMLATLGQAWRGLKGYKLKCHIALALYLLVILVVTVLMLVLIGIIGATGADQSVINMLGIGSQLVINVAILPMWPAVMIMAMRHAKGKSISSGEVFRHFGALVPLAICSVLQMIMIMIGFLLFILPGIYLMIAYMYALPLIVEKKMGPWHALETSRKAVTKVWFRFLGFILLLSLINMLGILSLGIVWIWTIPWSALAMAMVYEKIFGIEAHTLAD